MDDLMNDALRITSRRFNPDTDRVMVIPNGIRMAKDDDYIWKIMALTGRDTGAQVAIATQVALTGPVGCMPATHAITGQLATEAVWLTNATHQVDGIWGGGQVMDAAVLTSDGEVWTVNRAGRPQARVRFWDNFNEVDFPSRWRIEVVNNLTT